MIGVSAFVITNSTRTDLLPSKDIFNKNFILFGKKQRNPDELFQNSILKHSEKVLFLEINKPSSHLSFTRFFFRDIK